MAGTSFGFIELPYFDELPRLEVAKPGGGDWQIRVPIHHFPIRLYRGRP